MLTEEAGEIAEIGLGRDKQRREARICHQAPCAFDASSELGGCKGRKWVGNGGLWHWCARSCCGGPLSPAVASGRQAGYGDRPWCPRDGRAGLRPGSALAAR